MSERSMKQSITSNRPRETLALALDFPDLPTAVSMARRLKQYFGIAKVGLELFSAAGPRAVGALAEEGYEVFVDLKLHDIPNTVGSAAKVIGSLGASYLTVHCSGGIAMIQAAADGFETGAAGAGLAAGKLIGVTVLTSEEDASVDVLRQRMQWAEEGGCKGVVAAATDLAMIRDMAPQLIRVVPGIRLEGAERHDQKRTATPAQAIAEGANLLVIGRNVTEARDPVRAAATIYAAVESVKS